ncbi:cobalamin-binding protein [Halegenticoccus soli]|uniref:cobalamin-binding protein n=1 Tax=Halegenticoccus soli TaxID=1985678 RepID=UPI000C6D0E4F|nr:cobalamin-binding protein [Halegenticoccus soli]
MRIVSLLPSATEIVYALGLEPVAVSHECDYPPEAASKPAVDRSRVDPTAGSAEIDDQVRRAERDHGGVYEIDLDALREADPDLIVSQGVCDVCAVDSVLVEEAVAELDLDAEVLTTDPHGLDDVLADVERVGAATGREERAAELVADLRARIDAVASAAIGVDDAPRTLVLDWTDPSMVAGHWIPELVSLAGGEYGLADPGAASRPIEWEAVRGFDPEVLVVAPCGFRLEQTAENLSDLTGRDGWGDLTAVREGRAFAMDGHHYVNRPGPRLVDALEHLAALVHPERFDAPPPDVARSLESLEPPAEP